LRTRVPGRREGALAHVRLRLESLGAPGRADAGTEETAEGSGADAAGERAGAAEEEPSVQHAR
jgi:hypothetical protein